MTVGNLQPRKNLERLILAFDRVSERLENIQLVITGRRAWKYDEILRRMEDRCRGRIVFTDYVSEDELVALYNLCRLFVYPSLYEGFGLPAAEALCCGSSVVATRAGALPEIVIDGQTGILAPPADSSALAEAIIELLEDEPRRRAMAEAGREHVSKRFGWNAIAEKTEAVYEEITNRRGESMYSPNR